MTETIKNISISEYLALGDSMQYDIFVNVLNPKNFFCGREANYNKLTFDEVQVIKSILNRPNSQDIKDLFVMLYDIRATRFRSGAKIFLSQSVFSLFAAKRYLDDFIIQLSNREAKHLTGEPDEKADRVNAGKRLAPFNHQLTKIRLGKDYGLDPDVIGRWKYSKVFAILVAEKVQEDVTRDYNQIK